MRGGRLPAGRHQLRARLGRPGRQPGHGAARTSPASTSPARPRSSRACGQSIGDNIANYKTYPRIVGETGGKDFVFAHRSADVEALATALVRGAFEYQGQKCSAASRAYIPSSIWPRVKEQPARSDLRDQDGTTDRLPQLLQRRHRRQRLRRHHRLHRVRQGLLRRRDPVRRRAGTTPTGYFIEPTVVADHRSAVQAHGGGDLRTGADDLRLRRQGPRRDPRAVRHDLDRTPSPAPSSATTGRRRQDGEQRCATPPATSTSTTSRPARSSASSPSAAPAPPAPTTRPAPTSTSSAGPRSARSRRPSSRRSTSPIPSWAKNEFGIRN